MQSGTSQNVVVSRQRLRRRSWLLIAPALGALALVGVAVSARADAQPPGDGPGRGGFMARRLGQMLDKVGATPTQRSQIHAVWDGLRPQLKAARQQHEAVREQIMAAVTASTINPTGVEKLRQQAMTFADRTSALFTQGIVATAQVLTPDQRKIAQQEFEQHRGHDFGPAAP